VTRSRPSENESGSIQPDAVIDTVGLYCPVPIIKTAEKMKRMEKGAILEVLSDDRVILVDMPAWCRSTGNEYLGHRQEGLEYHLFVRKAGREEPKR
jgi:tRNA 2-thiouridine synthesizing protein A